MKWRIEYDNDTGGRGDSFSEWWNVTDGEEVRFTCETEENAKWLCDKLNSPLIKSLQGEEIKPFESITTAGELPEAITPASVEEIKNKVAQKHFRKNWDEIHSHELLVDECMTEYSQAKEKEIKELKDYIYEIRPKHDAYDSVCQALGIDNDIIGHFKTRDTELKYYRELAEAANEVFSSLKNYKISINSTADRLSYEIAKNKWEQALKNQKP